MFKTLSRVSRVMWEASKDAEIPCLRISSSRISSSDEFAAAKKLARQESLGSYAAFSKIDTSRSGRLCCLTFRLGRRMS